MQRWDLVVGLHDRRLTANGGDWPHGRRAGPDDVRRRRSDGRLADARRSRLHHSDLCLSYAPRLHNCLRDGTYLGLKIEICINFLHRLESNCVIQATPHEIKMKSLKKWIVRLNAYATK